jgi:hopanoid biosynthesis associated protein HpnK
VTLGHEKGVLSAASLMVAAPAATDAIARAKALADLRVGLHVTVADGRAFLPPHEISHLADDRGELPSNLAAAGVRWFFSPAAKRDLKREIAAQFEAFRATGLTLDHVNAHNHMHLHPSVLTIIMELAAQFGNPPIRLPWERPAGALTPWLALMRARLRRMNLRHNDAIVGMRATGHLTTPRVLAALDHLSDGATEFYFHPAVRTTATLEKAAPGYDRLGELAALLSGEIAAKLRALGLTPAGFRDLNERVT